MENEIYNTVLEIQTAESINEVNTDFYNICNSTYKILSCLTFIIVVIFLYQYLKAIIKRKR